jgi:threonine/homoserine/homoserine lactone efflux protein
MPTEELLALLAFTTAMSFTPGPNTTLAAALGANHGLRGAMRFVLAVPVGWCVMLLLCAFGLGAAVAAWPPLRWLIQMLGVAFMLWLAWQLARRDALPAGGAAGLRVGFGRGVALQFVNVKAWLAALAISGTWVAVQGEFAQRLALVLPVMMVYAFASNFSYALVGAALRGWLAKGRRLQIFNRVMAAVLAVTAVWMLRA